MKLWNYKELLGIIVMVWTFILITLKALDIIIDITQNLIPNPLLTNIINLTLAGLVGLGLLKIWFSVILRYFYKNLKTEATN